MIPQPPHGVRQPPRRLALPLQSFDAVGGDVRRQDLRNQLFAPLLVSDQPDFRHPSPAQGPDQGEAPVKGLTGGQVEHLQGKDFLNSPQPARGPPVAGWDPTAGRIPR